MCWLQKLSLDEIDFLVARHEFFGSCDGWPDEQAAALNELVAAGMVNPCLRRTFGFDEVGQAHQLMYENRHPVGNMAILVGASDPEQAEF